MSKQLSLLLPLGAKPEKLTAADIERMFGEWYAAYPRKIDPRRAAKAFEKVIRGGQATLSELLQGVATYVEYIKRAEKSKELVKHPTTWLNAGSWANEYDDDRPAVSSMSAALDRAYRLRGAGSGD